MNIYIGVFNLYLSNSLIYLCIISIQHSSSIVHHSSLINHRSSFIFRHSSRIPHQRHQSWRRALALAIPRHSQSLPQSLSQTFRRSLRKAFLQVSRKASYIFLYIIEYIWNLEIYFWRPFQMLVISQQVYIIYIYII